MAAVPLARHRYNTRRTEQAAEKRYRGRQCKAWVFYVIAALSENYLVTRWIIREQKKKQRITPHLLGRLLKNVIDGINARGKGGVY